MQTFRDQLNSTIRLEASPRRIVSLVPSQTQLLHAFGLEQEVVGITKFCIHPDEWFRSKERVGGTKSVDIEKVRALQPDLIIGNKEENEKSDIEALHEIAPVWMSDIYTLDDSLEMIAALGEITGRVQQSNELLASINSAFDDLAAYVAHCPRRKVMYFIWHDPTMTAGPQTFIDEMLQKCGFENVQRKERYPEASGMEAPEVVLLSSEPYPFNAEHVKMYRTLYPMARVTQVDGEMFSWYGSKLAEAPAYFKRLVEELTFED